MMSGILALVRHGQSEWNLQKRFTGWRDPDLTTAGIQEAQDVGRKLMALGIDLEIAYCSALLRARHTLDLILAELDRQNIPVISNPALNERDYGDLSGMSKAEAKERWGEEQIRQWRRSYDIAPPGGESLKDTVERVSPFFHYNILPDVLRGKATIVAAHGNSLRALSMTLEQLSPASVATLEISTADLIIYELGADAIIHSKKIYKSAQAIHES
jgi:2,3-bisphosphoglycerate-dependent phosphoglycerate mutase